MRIHPLLVDADLVVAIEIASMALLTHLYAKRRQGAELARNTRKGRKR